MTDEFDIETSTDATTTFELSEVSANTYSELSHQLTWVNLVRGVASLRPDTRCALL